VEVDVQRTRDGELVLVHDTTLVRTTDARRRHPDRDAVEVLRGTGTGLLLELKAPGLYPGIVEDVAATLHDIPGFVEAAAPAGRLAGSPSTTRR
jgi:glycerophosphoryl diester phosphodiesterase